MRRNVGGIPLLPLDPDESIPVSGAVPGSGGRGGAGGGYSFESRVHAEGAEEPADVIPDCLGGQLELVGDLPRRAPLLQKTKHLNLTRGEVRERRYRPLVAVALQEAEHADHALAAHQRYRADLHGDSRAGS